jgi:hypothetical protein
MVSVGPAIFWGGSGITAFACKGLLNWDFPLKIAMLPAMFYV